MDACLPRGLEPIPERQFGQLYSFVRRNAPQPDDPVFDPDETILAAVVMSRLIRPNPLCYQWALRVAGNEHQERLIPVDLEGGFLAFVPDRTARNWLDAGEAEELRLLLDRYWRDKDDLSGRVENALWLCEYTAREAYLDVAWPQVVTALEALIHTDRNSSRRQFTERVGHLASEVGAELDDAFLDAAYETRSEGVHGARIPFEERSTAAQDFGRLQRVLQLALRRAIEDRKFRSIFADADSVRSRWPVEGT